jgi:hypothetical protein
MKLRTIFTAAALIALFAAAPVTARADHWGDWDDHQNGTTRIGGMSTTPVGCGTIIASG